MLSTDDEFHKMMAEKSSTNEPGAFINDMGKFEKSFTKDELVSIFKNFKLVKEERVSKKAVFFGKEYECNHFWYVFQK